MTKSFVVIAHYGGMEPWGPEDVFAKGLTGSEEVVVLLAEALSRRGFRVCVAADSLRGHRPRIANGVRWDGLTYLQEHWRIDPKGESTVYVSSFLPVIPPVPFRFRKAIFWPHSIAFDDPGDEGWRGFDEIVCATKWQATEMLSRYAPIPDFRWIPYGLPDVERFRCAKVPGKCIYASSPDRGLVRLLRWWPEIVRALPEARLFVAYGRERMKERAKTDPATAGILHEIESRLELCRETVTDLGFVPHAELMRHVSESELWLYPTDFPETGCLIGRKAVILGARPVFSDAGCLPEALYPFAACALGGGIDDPMVGAALVLDGTREGLVPDPRIAWEPWDTIASEWEAKVLDPGPAKD